MKFKVGDKAVLKSDYLGEFKKGQVVKITYIYEKDGDTFFNFVDKKGNQGEGALSTRFEQKVTKNQRITALENEVAELKNAIAEQIQWNDKQKQFNDSVIKKLNEIYEAISPEDEVVENKQEVQRQTVTCAVAKTNNQQRAEIIEKAKKFVEEHKNNHKFVVQDNLVVAFNSKYDGKKQGYACCNPSDVFNEHIGKAIALGRALGLDVSEFEQAVQPSEVIKGMFVSYDYWYSDHEHSDWYGEAEVAVGTMKENNNLKNIKIINDTNAIY